MLACGHPQLAYGPPERALLLSRKGLRKNIGLFDLCTVLGASLAFAVGLLATWPRGSGDDATITYVFARNLANGAGFVWYEGGPPVYGSTTLVFTKLLALAGYLGLDIPRASIVLGAAGWAGAYFVLAYLVRAGTGKTAGLLVLGLGAVSTMENTMSSGMETGFYMFLAVSVFALYASGRSTLALLLAVVLVLTRIDGALVPVLVFGHLLLTGQPGFGRFYDAAKVAWPSVVTLSVCLAALWWYFGNPLPLSFRAKAGFEGKVTSPFQPEEYLETFAQPFGLRVVALAVLAFAVLGLLRAGIRWRNSSALIVLWAPLYISAYWLSGAPSHGWYYAAAIPGIYAALAWGASWPLRPLSEHLRCSRLRSVATAQSFTTVGVMLVLGAAYIGVLANLASASVDRIPYPETQPAFGELQPSEKPELAQAIIVDISERGIQDPDVVAYEIGYLGYMVPGRVHDILGLVSPDALENGGHRNPMYLIKKYNPEYVVIREAPNSVPSGPILRDRGFQSTYYPIFTQPPPPRSPNGPPYVIFSRYTDNR